MNVLQQKAMRITGIFLLQVLALGLLVWGYHVLEVGLLKAGITDLGAVTWRHFAPLYAKWNLRLGVWMLPAIGVLALFIYGSRRLYARPSIHWWGWVLAMFAVIGLSVSLIDQREFPAEKGSWSFLESYQRTGLEYIGALPLVEKHGVRAFLHRYSEPGDVSDVPLHVMTHPPGGVLLLWLVSRIFGASLWAAALSTILFTALAVPPIGWLARRLYGEWTARSAVALFLLTPSVILYTTTSMDGPFAVFPAYALAFFWAALEGRSRGWAVAAGLALAAALFMTYSAVFVVLVFCVATALTGWLAREKWGRALQVLFIAGVVSLGSFVLLYLLADFHLFRAVQNSIRADHQIMGSLPMTPLRYLNHSVGNLTAFVIGMGLPTVVLWLQETAAMFRERRVDRFQGSFVVSLLLISFSTLYTLETERIWLFMAPWVVIPAARRLVHLEGEGGAKGFLTVCLVLLVLQVLWYEACLYTYW